MYIFAVGRWEILIVAALSGALRACRRLTKLSCRTETLRNTVAFCTSSTSLHLKTRHDLNIVVCEVLHFPTLHIPCHFAAGCEAKGIPSRWRTETKTIKRAWRYLTGLPWCWESLASSAITQMKCVNLPLCLVFHAPPALTAVFNDLYWNYLLMRFIFLC